MILLKTLFSPVYFFFVSFFKDKVSIGVWIYLLVFCLVPLVNISGFLPVLYYLDDCSFVV